MGANTLVSRPRPIRVTWRFLSRDHLIPKSHFLVYVLYRNWVSISNHFRDNGHFLYLGHDLDLSRSRDVIGDVTNRSAICHFLLVSYCNRTSISNRFRDIRPHTDTHTHTHKHAASDFIFCPMQCIALDRQLRISRWMSASSQSELVCDLSNEIHWQTEAADHQVQS